MTPTDIIGAAAVSALEQHGYRIVAVEMDMGPDEFISWWSGCWPNRVQKPAAHKAFIAARKRGASYQQIVDGTFRYVNAKPADRPWLNPSTFLNQDRFNDVPAVLSDRRTGRDDYRDQLRQEIERGLAGDQGGDPRNGGPGLAALPHHRR